MPVTRTKTAEDAARILAELQQLDGIPLTRLDLAEVLKLPYKHTSAVLGELEANGLVMTKYFGKASSAKLFYAQEAA